MEQPETLLPRKIAMNAKRKRCASCGELKARSDFPKHSTSSDGFAAYCRDCKNGLARDRRQKDPIARFRHYIVTRIKNEYEKHEVPKDIHTDLEEYIGYKLFKLKKHVRDELKEREGITLIEAFKRGYHLDHRKPHSSFDIKVIGDEEFKKCWHYENLWLIPAKDNLAKGAKQDQEIILKIENADQDDEEDDEW
mgnify:CR=1 FL=1